MRDAAWWRQYRLDHAERLQAYNRARRKKPRVRAQRHASEARRRARRRQAGITPLMPSLQHGYAVSFWEDELRLDLAQEAALAEIEGRDQVLAVAAYRAREVAWHRKTCRYVEDLGGNHPVDG